MIRGPLPRGAVLAAPLLSILAGCASMLDGPGRHAAPVIERERPVPSEPWTADVAVPFVHGERSTGRTATGHRPLWRATDTDGADTLEILYPLYRRHREGDAFAERLFPFWWRDALHAHDGTDTDGAVVPFLWWGDEPGQGPWFLFFPLFGTVKQKFLMDEGTFVLFPAFLSSRNGHYRGVHVLWPLVHSGSGGGRSAFRILPFWSASDAEGRYRRRSLLWPVVHWGEEALDTDDPRSRWMVWPLFGREHSARTSSTTLLWPFFQWSDGPRSTARDLPFPFWRRRRTFDDAGAVETELRWLWPFHGTYRSAREGSTFCLWPVGRGEWSESSGRRREGFYVAPFWVERSDAPLDGGADDAWWKLWPLASGERRADGSSSWSTLAPVPLVRWETFDAHWGVFFELLRRRRDPDGSTATDALFSLVRHRSGPQGTRFRIPGLLSTTGTPGSSSWDLLEGLVGGASSEETGSSLRLLWFLRIPLGGADGRGDGR